ncbi:fibrobacter succinogenes major paralogous domain-containing protein [Flavobacteriales bacterium]|nr:fibrobacter succinogenes major paralogous domain-containing protein [Flavobacteriales bacterium]
MKKVSLIFILLIGFGCIAYAQTVTIGTQVWMTKNLDVSTFRNGDPIPQAKTNEEWKNARGPAWCYYENDPVNGTKYGKLYNRFAINDARGLAPQGYHIPSKVEWIKLTDYLGGRGPSAKTKLKSARGWKSTTRKVYKRCPKCSSWNAEYRSKRACNVCQDNRLISTSTVTESQNGSNSTKFSGLPGGCRRSNGEFEGIGRMALFFTSNPNDSWHFGLGKIFLRGYNEIGSTIGFSVRCLKSDRRITQTPIPSSPSDTDEKDIMARLDKMFEVFSAYDITKKSANYVEKLSTNDRKMVKSNTLDRIKTETNNDLSKLTKETLDDTFVKHLIKYMITDRNMNIFYIQYTPTADYKIKPEQIFESGVLDTDGLPNKERIYILYKTGDNFELISGTGAPNEAAATYNERVGQAVSGPDKNPVKPPVKKDVVNTSEERPEEELGLKNNKLLNDIYKKASDEGIESAKDLIEKNFSSRQKRIIESMNNEGYVVLRPINPDMYEEMDVKARYSEDFESFKEFKMYKLKTDGVSVGALTKRLKELQESKSIPKKQCKEIIEQYYEVGEVGDVDISDEELRSAAIQVCRCRRQHDFGGRLNEKLDEIGGTSWVQDPNSRRFAINYSNQTVGTRDNVISLK